MTAGLAKSFRRSFLSIALLLVPGAARAEPAGTTAPPTPQVIPLWPGGAPGFEARRDEPEQARDWWVRHVNNPSVTVYLPVKGKANGTAVVIAPGGGFRELVFNAEGKQPAEYLRNLGVTAFALKYRLPKEAGSPYTLEHVRADAYRAIRLVRSRAREWGIDPNRVGLLGFSAGGELASMVAYAPGARRSERARSDRPPPRTPQFSDAGLSGRQGPRRHPARRATHVPAGRERRRLRL